MGLHLAKNAGTAEARAGFRVLDVVAVLGSPCRVTRGRGPAGRAAGHQCATSQPQPLRSDMRHAAPGPHTTAAAHPVPFVRAGPPSQEFLGAVAETKEHIQVGGGGQPADVQMSGCHCGVPPSFMRGSLRHTSPHTHTHPPSRLQPLPRLPSPPLLPHPTPHNPSPRHRPVLRPATSSSWC